MKSDSNRPRPTTAFTLIELLVVIAIIAILAAMLLPVLATAKDKAASTQCRNNQHQMTIAMHMYADDNTDWLAFPGWDGGGTYMGMDVPGWLYTVTNGAIPDPGPGGKYQDNANAAYKTGLWFQYMPNPKAYMCPVDSKSRTYITKGLRNNRMSTYVMNGAVCGYGITTSTGQKIACKMANVWSTMCYLQWEPDENALGPGNPGAFDWNDSSNSADDSEGIGRLHSRKGGCIVAVGGHVQFLTREQWRADCDAPAGTGPGPGGKTYSHWSPYSNNGW
jgi:prepilin-type N-terminal cleavage/methylation domain-containing protein